MSKPRSRVAQGDVAANKILARPYEWVFVPEKKGYSCWIREFPGCVSQGETRDDAFVNLKNAARAWIEASLGLGFPIPEPISKVEDRQRKIEGKQGRRATRSGHSYPGLLGGKFRRTSDCAHGCGCWMGSYRSGGPSGVDPFGRCPNNPKTKKPRA